MRDEITKRTSSKNLSMASPSGVLSDALSSSLPTNGFFSAPVLASESESLYGCLIVARVCGFKAESAKSSRPITNCSPSPVQSLAYHPSYSPTPTTSRPPTKILNRAVEYRLLFESSTEPTEDERKAFSYHRWRRRIRSPSGSEWRWLSEDLIPASALSKTRDSSWRERRERSGRRLARTQGLRRPRRHGTASCVINER